MQADGKPKNTEDRNRKATEYVHSLLVNMLKPRMVFQLAIAIVAFYELFTTFYEYNNPSFLQVGWFVWFYLGVIGGYAAVHVIELVNRLVDRSEGKNGLSAYAPILAERIFDTLLYVLTAVFTFNVLLSGDHDAVRRWRLGESLRRTYERRPDMLARRDMSIEERRLLREHLVDRTRP